MRKQFNNILYSTVKTVSEIKIPIPVIGIGCGVLGLSLVKVSPKMGEFASTLLKSLEYRGYDSTGAIFQDDKQNTVLLKDVGAPSTLIETLGIRKQKGKIFCGQVRWATFGAVDKVNAQPHEVKCKIHIYGAHNGNITNTPQLKTFLQSQGHKILSNNDGEILVHTVEHYFSIELEKYGKDSISDLEIRKEAMRKAIILASEMMIGSYAAVIVDPVTELSYGIKAGSSLYFGIGKDQEKMCLVSSDLTAVLKFTKYLVDLKEGSFVEYSATDYRIFAFRDLTIKKMTQKHLQYKAGEEIPTKAVRSKLRVEDTELLPDYNYFMEQEIYAEVETAGRLVKIISGGSNTGKRMVAFIKETDGFIEPFFTLTENILNEEQYEKQKSLYNDLVNSPLANKFLSAIKKDYTSIYDELVKEDFERKYFFSSEKNLFIDLIGNEFDKKRILIAKALDSITEYNDAKQFDDKIKAFTELLRNTISNNRNIYTMSCGTSFHATKVGAMFFNEIAGVELIPVLPGEFRGQYSHCIQDNDVVIGVSQSGETKDLIDIFNDIDKLDVKKIVLVNNVNSTLGQEKSDISIPIFCGQEIAVPATKSFINQITLFYILAIKTAEMKKNLMLNDTCCTNAKVITDNDLNKYYKFFQDIPLLIKNTIDMTEEQIDFVASKIYLEPSIHILATRLVGVAKEGALKIRETVLNHTEGQEGSEFKHGPNTILGKNTIYGLKNIKALLRYAQKVSDQVEALCEVSNIPSAMCREITKALNNYIFDKSFPFQLSKEGRDVFNQVIKDYNIFDPTYRNYPLIYITGPVERDVNLTISQINTHKIRGADTFIIAEENEKLIDNMENNPHSDGSYYGYGYIMLPQTGDTLMTAFSSTVALQLLALKMSIKKMEYLDKLGFVDHGVHPDVPKNVSKSITVD